MSFTYANVLRGVALRLNAIEGPQPSQLATNYTNAPTNTALFTSGTFPYQAIQDAILLAEGTLVAASAAGRHPWRVLSLSVTAPLSHNSDLPKVSAAGVALLGPIESVWDASDSIECEPMSAHLLLARVRNAGASFRCSTYAYNAAGARLLHTRASVIARAVSWDRTASQTAQTTGSACTTLPDAAENLVIAGGVALLTRDGAFAEQAQYFARYFDAATTALAAGRSVAV